MPTQHISPDSHALLQDVAQGLLKARKVVVVTGAGISTNSGIPDFRSENGLYSLIQAQFDAAARHGPSSSPRSETDRSDESEDAPPSKRRKLSPEPELPSESSDDAAEQVKEVIEVCEPDTIIVRSRSENTATVAPRRSSRRNSAPPMHNSTSHEKPRSSTPQPRQRHPLSISLLPTSPLSSPPRENRPKTPEPIPSFDSTRLADTLLPSSPLSSPPAIIFEPSVPSSPSDEDSQSQSSTPPSEVDATPPSNPLTSSQTSNSGRTLPVMKGKDLFDAAIWSDPLKTSVFYTFATTLRQKIKDVKPTSSHRFISHLRDRGKLVRCYTQNIDQIEEKVGLSTSLKDGPGVRGRFSRRSTANATQLNKMVEEAASNTTVAPAEQIGEAAIETNEQLSSQVAQDSNTIKTEEDATADHNKAAAASLKREASRSGVECVFLHGSLEQLRCFLCGRVCSWDDDDREVETLSGQQPECPHCAGATAAREERGKRALGVGKLRPDIVLYGEEHPNAHLISPIVTHDLALQPDMLLILGTSLRVHGLKVMVREFAKAVHAKGGKVVFVNFTKPSESSWGDIIDYWVEWDCDAWVANLQERVPKLWQDLEAQKPRKKRESDGAPGDNEKQDKKKPPAAYPVALRDSKDNGAYCVLKIVSELHKISGHVPFPPTQQQVAPSATAPSQDSTIQVVTNEPPEKQDTEKPKPKRSRKSAPGVLERPKKPPSTLNPNHGRARRKKVEPIPQTPSGAEAASSPAMPQSEQQLPGEENSILHSVKSNARVRKPKRIFGEDATPTTRKKQASTIVAAGVSRVEGNRPAKPERSLQLAPFLPQPPSGYKGDTLEPKSPPHGPLMKIPPSISNNRKAFQITTTVRGLEQPERSIGINPPTQAAICVVPWPTQPAEQVSAVDEVSLVPMPAAMDEEECVRTLVSLRGSDSAVQREQPPVQKEQSRIQRWTGRLWSLGGS